MRRFLALLISFAVIGGLSWSSAPTAEARGLRPMDAQSCFSDYAQFFEDGIHKGRSWVHYMCYDPGHAESWENVPNWFNDRASALCVHSDSGHQPYWLAINVYARADRGFFSHSYQVASGSATQCWNIWVGDNDTMSSVGSVWVLR